MRRWVVSGLVCRFVRVPTLTIDRLVFCLTQLFLQQQQQQLSRRCAHLTKNGLLPNGRTDGLSTPHSIEGEGGNR